MSDNRGHKFERRKGLSVVYCVHCGHVPLNNRISRIVTADGCDYENKPGYQAWKRRGYRFTDQE